MVYQSSRRSCRRDGFLLTATFQREWAASSEGAWGIFSFQGSPLSFADGRRCGC
jgi:hypothetical protein